MADAAAQDPPLPSRLPVLPLRSTVVFPLTVQPLAVNRAVSVDAVNRALAADRMLVLVMQVGDADDPEPAQLRRVGTVAVIRQMAKGAMGLQILVEGVARVRLDDVTRDGNVMDATITAAPEPDASGIEIDAYLRSLRDLVEKAFSLATGLSSDLRSIVSGIDEPLRLVYLLATLIDMKPEDKQLLLEQDDLRVKLSAISAALKREVELLELKGKIESQAQQEMSDAQRQYYLRQQLKAIQSELGEEEGQEITELRKRLNEAKLPEAVLKQAMREVDRLERMSQASPEYQMLRTYLDWVLEVPWSVTTPDRLDPRAARVVLDEDHYDLDKIKDRIVEYLAVRKLKNDMKGPILCFAGPPGVGKTSLGQSIARAMNRKFVRISLGGVRDEAEIRGHRRTYIGSMPGRLVQALKQAGSMNPVFMLDEIDKLQAGGFSGRPGIGDAGGARPGAEPHVPRSLPRSAGGSVEGAVHRHGQQPQYRAPGAARSHGDHQPQRLHRRGQGPHRAQVPGSAADEGTRPARRRPRTHRRRAQSRGPGVHARSRRTQPGATGRHDCPQAGRTCCRRGYHRPRSRRRDDRGDGGHAHPRTARRGPFSASAAARPRSAQRALRGSRSSWDAGGATPRRSPRGGSAAARRSRIGTSRKRRWVTRCRTPTCR